MALAPLARFGIWWITPELRWSIGTAFQTNADALAAGCVLAGIRANLWSRPAYVKLQKSLTFFLIPAFGIGASVLLSHEEPPLLLVSYAVGQSVLNIAIALCIDRCVRHHNDLLGRLLNWRPMVFIGVLSYSLYLWQEPFLNRLSESPINWFPINLILLSCAALASYYLVERPCLDLRRRIERSLAARQTGATVPMGAEAVRAAAE
jgi:peptidoglycan/LPS O-acetylase OafA/YrhL